METTVPAGEAGNGHRADTGQRGQAHADTTGERRRDPVVGRPWPARAGVPDGDLRAGGEVEHEENVSMWIRLLGPVKQLDDPGDRGTLSGNGMRVVQAQFAAGRGKR
jgi:hypothetical protein